MTHEPAPEIPTIELPWRQPIDIGDGTAELTDMTVEEIAASPDGSYPAGSGVVVTLVVRGQKLSLSQLSAGYDSEDVKWIPGYRIALLKTSAGNAPTATIRLDKVTSRPVGEARVQRVARGQSIALAGPLQMQFVAHSHKRISPGQRSPLIVELAFYRFAQGPDQMQVGTKLEEQSTSLYLEESRQWSWRNFRFELKDHAYADWMLLEIVELALEPVSAPAN